MIILLDSGPLGLVTNPKATRENVEATQWLYRMLQAGIKVHVPEITDYELRRELLRGDKLKGLKRLDTLKSTIGYVPLNTEVMLKAAQLWAESRKRGMLTADDKALDADVILAAQAIWLKRTGEEVIIATTNARHFVPFTTAKEWRDIS